MNKVILSGRLTRDPEVRYSQGDNPMAIARYTLAVERRGKQAEGQPTADFISCIAFGRLGEFAEKYLHKGIKIIAEGHIQTGNYTNKEGVKVYTTDVIIDSCEFAESKNASQGNGQQAAPAPAPAPATPAYDDGFMNIPEGMDEDLPY